MPVTNIAPPGTPKPVETPRTKRLKEVRIKRLAYFESQQPNQSEFSDLEKHEEGNDLKELSNDTADRKHVNEDTEEGGSFLSESADAVWTDNKTANLELNHEDLKELNRDVVNKENLHGNANKEGEDLHLAESVKARRELINELKSKLNETHEDLNEVKSDINSKDNVKANSTAEEDNLSLTESVDAVMEELKEHVSELNVGDLMVNDLRVKSAECVRAQIRSATPSGSYTDRIEREFYRPESQNSALPDELESDKLDLFEKIQSAKEALNNIGNMRTLTPLPDLSKDRCLVYSPTTFDNEVVANLHNTPGCNDEFPVGFSGLYDPKLLHNDDRLSIESDETIESLRMNEPLSVVANDQSNSAVNVDTVFTSNSTSEDHIVTDHNELIVNEDIVAAESPKESRKLLQVTHETSNSNDESDGDLKIQKNMNQFNIQEEHIEIPMIHVPDTEINVGLKDLPEQKPTQIQGDFKETWESLEDVLGKNRLTRLMKNLIETDQVLGEEMDTKLLTGIAGDNLNDDVLKSIWFDSDKSEDEETAILKENTKSSSGSINNENSRYISEEYMESGKNRPVVPMHNEINQRRSEYRHNARKLSSSSRDKVKCVYSVDEIYHQAERISSGSLSSPPVTPEKVKDEQTINSHKGIEVSNNNDNLQIDLNFETEDPQLSTVEDPNVKSTLDRYFASMESAGLTPGREMEDRDSQGRDSTGNVSSPGKIKPKKTKMSPVKRVTQSGVKSRESMQSLVKQEAGNDEAAKEPVVEDKTRKKLVMNMVTVCPECVALNKTDSKYCSDCGYILIHVAPTSRKPKKSEPPKKSHVSNRKGSLLNRSVKEELNREKLEQKYSILNRRILNIQNDEVQSHLSSENFEYSPADSPGKDLPDSLKAQLSINLRDSVQSSLAPSEVNSARGVEENDPKSARRSAKLLAELSENISFEYERSSSPVKNLPGTLQAELSLDLPDSMCGSLDSERYAKAKKEGGGNLSASVVDRQARHQAYPPPLAALDSKFRNNTWSEGISMNNKGIQKLMKALKEEARLQDGNVSDNNNHTVGPAGDAECSPKVNDAQPLNQPKPHVSFAAPTVSKSRPKSACGRQRPASAGLHSRKSQERMAYERKWEKSSIAWDSYDAKELSSFSSINLGRLDTRDSSMGRRARPGSAKVLRESKTDRCPSPDVRKSQNRPKSAGTSRSSPVLVKTNEKSEGGQLLTVKPAWKDRARAKLAEYSCKNTYSRYIALTPRLQDGEISYFDCLPDELILHVFSYLRQRDLAACRQVTKLFHRVGGDDTLWRNIVLKKKQRVSDTWLLDIGKHMPQKLSLIQCQGEKVTANGLRELFRQCADSLQELNFTGCSRGYLTGDHILLHAASRCRNITHLDASWSNINDNGVVAISEASDRLESVCLNGCQGITDEALLALVKKHGIYLRVLELFGCFNLTAQALVAIRNHCKSLKTLNLGQCWKLTDTSICHLTSSLGMVENLDVRGIKQMTDACVHQIVRNCPRLESLSVANCSNLTDVSMLEVATYCSSIRTLDVCGCKKITNGGVRSIATNCQMLEFIDLSSTGISSKGISVLASYCSRNLEVIKLNFLKNLPINCLIKLARNCKRLKKVYLYGVSSARQSELICQENPRVWIEM